jgi:hypothetical protein
MELAHREHRGMVISGRPKSWKATGVLLAALLCAGAAAIALYATTGAEVSGETPEERAASVRRIVADRPPGARRALGRAAGEKSPEVRKAAMAGLAHFLEEEDRSLVEGGTKDKDAGVREVSAETLGQFRDSPAADVLIRLIREDPSERVRMAALRGLAKCDDPRSIVVLLETADKDPSKPIKLQAMKCMLWKFRANLRRTRDPANEALWRDLIQRWKWDGRVRRAYAAAGVPLIDRPQDIFGRDFHPERRTYAGRSDR